MEAEQKPSRLRAKRSVARLLQTRSRDSKTAEKPASPAGETHRTKPAVARTPPSVKRRKASGPTSDSAEVIQLKRKVEELQKCIEQLRETTQIRANRLGTLHSPRPHRLLQGKMSELPTLREDERLDSLEETTADEQSSDISDIKPSDLAQLSREELRQLCCELQRAHHQLRQAHELMVAKVRETGRSGRARSRVENELLASQSLVRDLEAALATKGVDPSALQEKSVLTAQNLCLTQKLRDLRAREVKVKNELQELRDLNELMEFRILELEGCQEKSGDRSSPVPTLDQTRTDSSQQQDETAPASSQTLEAAGEDRRHSVAPAAIEAAPAPAPAPAQPPAEHQLAALGEERHHWQEKIAELQNTILQLEAALEEAGSHHLSPSTDAKPPTSPPPPALTEAASPPPPLTSGHQRQPSGHSESELSDYHSDSNDGQSARRSPASSSGGSCLCGGRLSRPLASPDHPPLQESGIFDVDVDEKAVQTEIQESEVSMRELIDLTSEIARLTSVQEQLEKSPLPIAARIRHADSEQSEEASELVTEVSEVPVPEPRTVSVCAEVQTEYVHDQLLCDYKDMCERYEKVKKTCDAVQDEKNELEEAENDARLMVQRLEMKIFASNEVEKMLSSDLADEQERCRQLQRQLNSVKLKHQADLKARQAQAAELPAQMTERVQQLEREVEALTQRLQEAAQRAPAEDREQQTEAVDGAWQTWRAADGSTSDTLSSGDAAASASDTSLPPPTPGSVTNTESLTRRLDQAWSFNDSGVGDELSRASATESEATPSAASAATPAARPAKRPRTEAEEEAEEADVSSATLSSDVTMCTECTKRLGEVESMESPKNSMDSNLSERESYYSECIQELETQKAELRKRWEEEKTSMLKQVEETCQESCELKQKMEEILRDGESAKESLSKKVAQLKLELREQAKSSEKDRNELIQSHTMKAQSLQEQQVLLKRRMRAAEDVINALKVEFDLCQVDSGRDSPDPCYTLVLDRVRHLHQSQKDLASQVHELEKKEGAYRETLQEADKIMHNVEIRYQKKIEELEDQLREDKNKITLMEETEAKLKQALKSVSNGKHDKDRVTELLDKLIETENEDLKLKEKVYRLERRERELSIRLREEERAAEGLRHELRDQEELLRELDTARRDLSAATEQLAVLPALRQRAAELQQSEEFLRGRIEELEQAELTLQETLRNTRNAQAHKERRSAEQVSSLQQDVESLQASIQELQLAAADSGEERSKLRRELQEARRQLQDVHRDLETTSGTANETETQFRNEVCKLRNQLSLVNSQLNDNDSYSCQLRDQLEKTQSENADLRAALDGCKSRSEQDVLQLNLEISRREEEINALSEQLAELDKTQLTGELDLLAEQENTLVKLLALAKQSNEKIQNCDQCTSEVDGALRSVIQELEQLTLLLSGSQGDQSLQSQLRDAENLASAAAALSSEPSQPPRPELLDSAIQTADLPEGACCAELRRELVAKEEELSLVDSQGSYLQAELEQRDRETRQLRSRLGETDALLEHQRLQHGRLSELLAQTQFARDEAAARADGKDALLGAVLRHLRAVLEAHQAAALVRGLRESAEQESDRQDLDREMVCQILQQIVTVMRERVLRSRSSRTSSPEQAGAGSRIPRPVPRSRESTPPNSPRKELPRTKAPVPRCLQPKRGARQVPPVGVARPYRSTAEARERVSHPHPRSMAHKTAPPPALPPPENFQIIRAVGGDSLLIYWSPSDDQRISGYEIFVNNRLQQVIRNPQRTKALLPSLRLASQLQLAIRAVGPMDSFSALSWAEYRPGQLTGSRHHRGPPASHPVTT
ncbi:plectin-like isoform X3 [Amphibalanus amphitrite]|nr:plectin-like isoform X3 [Amphibalanus amphitrite]